MTKQRKIIYDIIMASTHHLSAEDIFLRAKKVNPTIAMGTVYRNLGLMCEDKEITKLVIPGAADRYDKSATPHQHLTCSVCGRIKDVEFNNFPAFLKKETGEDVTSYEIYLEYICEDCRKKNG